MSKRKPLSYASLKAVIEHMDPNLRVLLSVKLPSIRHAEKATPMRLEDLEISEYGIFLKKNSYFHRIKVMRYINGLDGLRPYEARGVPYTTDYDVDKYGIIVIPFISTPGDLDFGNNADPHRLRTEEELRQVVALPPTSQDRLASTDLIDLEMRKADVESPYIHFIQLSNIYQDCKELIIEKVAYNQNLSIAIKYMIQKFLGGRAQGGPVKVKNLYLSCTSKYLRLPIDLNLDVQHLFVRNNKNGLSIFRPLLASHWSSLESITVDTLDNRDREILSSIDTVGVLGCPHWSTELPYRRMKFCHSNHTNQQYINIAKNLKVTQPSVGSHYTFILWKTKLKEVMELMKADDEFRSEQLQASKVTKYPECFILRINNRSDVLIYFSFDPTKNYASFRYSMEMEVQPRVENLHN
ncbi:hypothetical protein CRE_14573 [Caenorhabditis remanei]|uniref:F-box domain-containing protein n=1 Tax=Caenorhabditis remanei TaxID=31234 RepID=E3M9L0_CAERE|nr:hypothetical protein CRE_14573 [Caenorhabditis remanei]